MKLAVLRRDATIWLDYGEAAEKDSKLLASLSSLVPIGRFLWTASDEGRTIECLERSAKGFRLRRQVLLDQVFPELPRDRGEADLEAIDIANGRLWICGSHSLVRKRPKKAKSLDRDARDCDSRHLLGYATLEKKGTALADPGTALPFAGPGSLREALRDNGYIRPFIDLTSKKNGLGIEGMCVGKGKLFLGLRAPLVDRIAIILEVAVTHAIDTSATTNHLVDLGGLGVRDLTRIDGGLLVLAGPVPSAKGPFQLYRWMPRRTDRIQEPDVLGEWQRNGEKPEGICALDHDGKPGFAVLYDSPDRARIKKTRYRADWIAAKNVLN